MSSDAATYNRNFIRCAFLLQVEDLINLKASQGIQNVALRALSFSFTDIIYKAGKFTTRRFRNYKLFIITIKFLFHIKKSYHEVKIKTVQL